MLLFLLACAPSHPTEVRATGPERLHFTSSGGTWEAPDTQVGDLIWQLGDHDFGHGAALDQPAAFVAGSTATIEVIVPTRKPWTLSASGTWASGADPVELGSWTASGDGQSFEIPLPERIDALTLALTVHVEGHDPVTSTHTVVTTWAAPIPDTPLYRQPLVWTADWLAGQPSRAVSADPEAQENELALLTLRGMFELGETDGRTYGPFPRPKEKDNQAHVFLDFKQCACGELRGGLMNLLETHGVDTNWVILTFRNPSPDKLSMYETREIAAIGTDPKVWQHWNHVAVEVNGQVYDPTYNLHHPDFVAYEDDLFERYCYGEDEKCKTPGGWCQQPRPEGTCIDNPPGYDPDDPTNGMLVIRGENY
jgi:hypothetical protein